MTAVVGRFTSVAALGTVTSCLALCGCTRRAPDPEDCVAFAEVTFGHPFEVIVENDRAKAIFDRLVMTCLTAPFDRRVFTCTKETRAPMDCLRRIQPDLFGDQRIDMLVAPSGRERF